MDQYCFEKDGKIEVVQFRTYKSDDFPMYLQCVQAFYKDGYPYKEYLQETYLHQQIAEKKFFSSRDGNFSDKNDWRVPAAAGMGGFFRKIFISGFAIKTFCM